MGLISNKGVIGFLADKEETIMKVGDLATAKYVNGKTYSGTITKIKEMPRVVEGLDSRILVRLKMENGDYRSLYLDSCEKFDTIASQA